MNIAYCLRALSQVPPAGPKAPPPPAAQPHDSIEFWAMVWTAANAAVLLLNVIVSWIAANAAKDAAKIAKATLEDQKNTRKQDACTRLTQRRIEYFRALVVDPAIDVMPRFRSHAMHVIRDGAREVARLDAVRPKQEFDDAVRRIVRSFNEVFDPLEDQLLARARTWRDEKLSSELTTALNEIQDKVTVSLPRLIGDASLVNELETVIDVGCADILAILIGADLDHFAESAGQHVVSAADPEQMDLPLGPGDGTH